MGRLPTLGSPFTASKSKQLRLYGSRRETRHVRPLLVALVAPTLCLFSIASCDSPGMRSRSLCPTGLKGVVAEGERNSIECIPDRHVAVEARGIKKSAYTDYEIAVTAEVVYKINDEPFFNSNPGAFEVSGRLEAVTAAGVVLGSESPSFRLVRGSTRGTMSGKILYLSADEITRVVAVRAGWEYR